MLSALKRHDRVQTIGGVIGAVVEVKDDEVVLKVDETNNIKMRFARSAVQQIIAESSAGDVAT
jgi:preprotein translocase subunit YajC